MKSGKYVMRYLSLDIWMVTCSGVLVELTLALLCLSQWRSKVKDVVLAHLHERLYISASFMRSSHSYLAAC